MPESIITHSEIVVWAIGFSPFQNGDEREELDRDAATRGTDTLKHELLVSVRRA
jgi:hypothetical protein